MGMSWSLGSVPSVFQLLFPLKFSVSLNVCRLGVKHGFEENLNVFSNTSSFPWFSPLWNFCSQLPTTVAVLNSMLCQLNPVGCGLPDCCIYHHLALTGLFSASRRNRLTSYPMQFFFSAPLPFPPIFSASHSLKYILPQLSCYPEQG